MSTTDGTAGHTGGEHTSRWPFVAAIGAALLYAGVGLALVGRDLVPTPLSILSGGIGAVVVVVGLAGWAYEAFVADYWAEHGRDRIDVYVGGMALFLVSDVATFLAGFVYYGFIRIGTWPPGELPPLLGSLVLLNTLVLVASSVTFHYGHHALEAGDRRRFLAALGATVLLGVGFLAGQAFEYYEFVVEEAFNLTSSAYASAFFGLTGLHGLHVTLGVVLLAITLARALRGQHSATRDAAVRTVGLYWHVVDAVWLFLVLVLYAGAALG